MGWSGPPAVPGCQAAVEKGPKGSIPFWSFWHSRRSGVRDWLFQQTFVEGGGFGGRVDAEFFC